MLLPFPSSQTHPPAVPGIWRAPQEPRTEPAADIALPRLQPTAEMPDEQLLELHLAGCPESFGILLERHRRVYLRVAVRMLRDICAAEDEVQTAFLKAYMAADRFDGQGKFSSWLGQIVVNQCRMRLRMERRRKTDPSEEIVSTARCERRSQEDALASREVIELVRREALRLPAPLRDVLRSMLMEGRTQIECGYELGLSRAAVKSRLRRAREEFKQRMAKYHGAMGGLTLLR